MGKSYLAQFSGGGNLEHVKNLTPTGECHPPPVTPAPTILPWPFLSCLQTLQDRSSYANLFEVCTELSSRFLLLMCRRPSASALLGRLLDTRILAPSTELESVF